MKRGIVIVDHGSKRDESNAMLERVAKLFGEMNCINLNKKQIYCRPHEMSVVDKSNIKAKVIESKFLGSHYKIIAKFEKNKIIFFSNESIKKNSIIFLKINQKNKFNFSKKV